MSPKISICFTDVANLEFTRGFFSDLESRGIYGLFLPENSHVPVERPGTLKAFSDINRLGRFYDPFPCLGAVAALTSRIKLGTSVCLLTQRRSFFLKGILSTIQRISVDRFIFGVAGGFIREAMENHGSDFRRRWEIVEDEVGQLRAHWDLNLNSTRGLLFPPVWIGSNSKEVPKRVARYADGWMTRKSIYPGDAIEDAKSACNDVGRDFREISMISMDASLDIAEVIADHESGYQHFIYFVSSDSSEEMGLKIDNISKLIERLLV